MQNCSWLTTFTRLLLNLSCSAQYMFLAWLRNFRSHGFALVVLCFSPGVASHQTAATLSTRVHLSGISLKVQIIPTLTVMLGRMIQMFCASIAKHARLGSYRTLRLTGRRWQLWMSYSSSSSLLCTLLVAVHSGITWEIIGSTRCSDVC